MRAGRGKTDNYVNIVDKPKANIYLTAADVHKVPKRSRAYITVCPSSELEVGAG
jgi:hypothetical protein